MPQSLRHSILLAVILVAVVFVYAGVTRAYFCSYDDFIETNRAAFEDTQNPSRVFTTSHFNSHKYRPLNRLVTLATYQASDGDPFFFRARNLFFHLVNIGLVYALGWLLFRSIPVSAAGAALFALHPMANQSIVGAVWTNTMAHSALLLGLVMFIVSAGAKWWKTLLIAGVVSGSLGLLAYDPNAIVFAVMAIYLLLYWRSNNDKLFGGRFLLFAAVSGFLMGAYFTLRFIFVSRGWSQAAEAVPDLETLVTNLTMYVAALFFPLDPVFANEVLNTPLPSEFRLNGSTMAALAVAACAAAIGVAVLLRQMIKRDSAIIRSVDWRAVVFLVSAIGMALMPFLLFQSHPSETYLYLPVAFYALLLGYMLNGVIHSTWAANAHGGYTAIILLLAGLFAAGTWTRNSRVVACATTAQQIIGALPSEVSTGGPWTIYFAAAPESDKTRRYGFYGFRGIHTIGHDSMANRGVTSAIQLAYRNPSLRAEVVYPKQLPERCRHSGSSSRHLCFMVYSDGRMTAQHAVNSNQ